MTDYRTPQTLEVLVDGTVVFSQDLGGTSDTMQYGMDQHYAAIYARILNPGLPAGVPAVFRWTNKYGTVQLDGTVPALHPNYEYMIPEVLFRFGPAATSPFVADPANPTDAELSAAIERGLAAGTLIDAGDWLAAHADLA